MLCRTKALKKICSVDCFTAYGFEVVQKKTGINKTSDLFSSREHIPVSPAIHANVEMESNIMKSNDRKI